MCGGRASSSDTVPPPPPLTFTGLLAPFAAVDPPPLTAWPLLRRPLNCGAVNVGFVSALLTVAPFVVDAW